MEPVTLVSLMTKPTKVVPKVEELVPPLATGRMPVTSEVKDTWPLLSSPPTDLTMPVPKEDKVVEPEGLMLRRLMPVAEATVKGLTDP